MSIVAQDGPRYNPQTIITAETKNIIAGTGLILGIAIFLGGIFINEGYNLCIVPGFLLAITSVIILAT